MRRFQILLIFVLGFLQITPLAYGKVSGLPTIISKPQANVPTEHPIDKLPYSPSLDLTSLDRSVDPCGDFYTFACGSWIKKNPIPADESSWGVYEKLQREIGQFLWGLLEQARDPKPGRTTIEQKVGDYFASCMDEEAVEKAGMTPLGPYLNLIAQMKTIQDLPLVLGQLHLFADERMLFSLNARSDVHDASKIIANARMGGLGLPNRDYYLEADVKLRKTRKKYTQHVEKMLVLTGTPQEKAREQAKEIVRLETAFSTSWLTQVEQRDPHNFDHKMKISELQALTPSFSWQKYLEALGVSIETLNVSNPKFFKQFELQLKQASLEVWKNYLRWHLILEVAEFLPKKIDREHFSFYGKYLEGMLSPPPRWKRCAGSIDLNLGEALGQLFVEKTFSRDLKAQTLTMVKQIEKEMETRIKNLSWMQEATKQQALGKLRAIHNKIGYPDKWRDYSSYRVVRDNLIGNYISGNMFEKKRLWAKIGQSVDRDEWLMTPQTVSAYNHPTQNSINFPAAILLPPLFDSRMDAAPNYGDTGATVGHELIHVFDDLGRQFDAQGNLRDWWLPEDDQEFKKRIKCVVDQYAQYPVVDDIKINSKLTQGEDLADWMGLVLAYQAWKSVTEGQHLLKLDGFTPEQRFFLGFAQWDCSYVRDAQLRVNARVNPHSPAKYRINGVLVNMPEFAAAFSCTKEDSMVKKKVCEIW